MASDPVTMVRIYLSEGDHRLRELVKFLHDQEKVSGLTVFRGITGFGKSGKLHAAGLIDISLDLPLVIEFFDAPDRAARIMADLEERLEPGHMVSWPAQVNSQ